MEKTCRLSVLAMSVRVRYGVACARDCFSGRRASRSSNVWCNVHLAW
nr:MAG TPA: hypothetical protein [Bacteriophage sp.]